MPRNKNEKTELLSDKNKSSRYKRFLRWWHRQDLLTRIFLRGIKSQQPVSKNGYQDDFQKNEDEDPEIFREAQINDDVPSLISLPRKRIIFAENLSWSMKLTFFKVWPTLFLALTAKDIVDFALRPNERYGATLSDIFGGTATNQHTWSSHLGANLFGVVGGPVAISVAPFLFMVPAIIVRAIYVSCSELKRAEYDVIWNNNKNSEYKYINFAVNAESSQLDKIIKIANLGGIGGFFALQSLARIARNLKEESSDRKKAIEKLNATSGLFAAYARWTLGEHESIFSNLFWLISLFNLCAFARYVEADVFAIIRAANVARDRQTCESQHNQFTYLLPSESYECTVCGDWPFVNYRTAFEAQSCLDNLLVQNTTPQVLADGIRQFNIPRNFTCIDLSKQPWTTWSDDGLNLVLATLKQYLPDQVEVINFSLNDLKIPSPSPEQVGHITQFLAAVPAKTIDLSNLNLNVTAVMDGLQSNAVTETIILSGNNVTGSALQAVVNVIPKFTHLNKLQLARCNITNTDLNKLNQGLQNNSTITVLGLMNNLFDEEGLINFVTTLPQTKVKELDLSGNKITQPVAQILSDVIPQSSLQSLSVSECELDNDTLMAVAPGAVQLQSFVVSNNKFDDFGAANFMDQTHNSTLLLLDFSNNQLITDDSAQFIADALIQNSIQQIDVSGIPLTISWFKQITSALPHSHVKKITANNIPFGDEAGAAVAEMYNNQTAPLTDLILRNIGLTSEGAILIFNARTNLTEIDLGRNAIDGEIAPHLAKAMVENTQLASINLEHNQLNGTVVEAVADALPRSSVKKINFNHNPDIGGETGNAAVKLAQQLITAIPNPDKLYQNEISLDETHALLQAKPTAQLKIIGMAGTRLNANDVRALCRVNTVVDAEIDTRDNPDATVDLHTCKTTTASKTSTRNSRHLTQFFSSTAAAHETPQQPSSLLNVYIPEVSTYPARSAPVLPASTQQNTNSAMGIAVLPTLLFAVGIIGAFVLICYTIHASTSIYRRFYPTEEKPTDDQEVEQEKQLRI